MRAAGGAHEGPAFLGVTSIRPGDLIRYRTGDEVLNGVVLDIYLEPKTSGIRVLVRVWRSMDAADGEIIPVSSIEFVYSA